MWNSIVITNNEITNRDIKKIVSGEKSAIIIKNFYEKRSCKQIIKKINSTNIENDSKQFNHIGPFLMNYTTKKEKYFQNSKKALSTSSVINFLIQHLPKMITVFLIILKMIIKIKKMLAPVKK